MDGIFDHLGKKKHKHADETISRSPQQSYSKRVLSMKPKGSSLRQQSITPNRSSFEAGSAELHFARDTRIPPENDVNALFNCMLERRGIHDEKIKQSMDQWGVEKKWLMIHQDHQAELLASGVKQSKLQDAVAERASLDISRLPPSAPHQKNRSPLSTCNRSLNRQNTYSSATSSSGPTPTKSTSSPITFVNNTSTSPTTSYDNLIMTNTSNTDNGDMTTTYPFISPKLKRSRSIINLSPVKSKSTSTTSTNRNTSDHYFDTNATDHTSPEFFIRKFLDPNLRSVTPKIAASLEVSLRTRSIDWVVKFIHLKGFHVLSYALDYLNHNTEYRRDAALELEIEIVKCIKAIVNTKAGGKEVMDHPEYIHAVVFSILCPQWQTRKMVCELLAFLCYMHGHEHVVRGFELLRKFKKTLGLYDSWMAEFLRTIYDDKNKLKSERLPESHLLDYALSTMILINALTKIPSDVNYRIYMRNQFNAAGLQSTIIPKLEALEYELLNIQIESYNELAENDMDDAFGEDLSQSPNFSQPSELFDRALENISDSARGTEYFISVMKHLLWIKGDPQTKCQFYHMINIIIQQIVMDKRPHENSDDFASTFGMAVGNVIQNFNDLERLKEMEKEANELKEQYEQLTIEKDQLQNEVEKLRILPNQIENEAQKQRNIDLKQENDSIRDVLKTSKETIAMLQERLTSVENRENRGSDGTIIVSDDWKVSHRKTARVSFDETASHPKSSELNRASDIKDSYTISSSAFGFGNFHIPFFGRKSKKRRPISASSIGSQGRHSMDSLRSSSNQSYDRRSLSMHEGSDTPIPSAPPPPSIGTGLVPPPPPPPPSPGAVIPTAPVNSISSAVPPPPPPPPPNAPGLIDKPMIPTHPPPLIAPLRKEIHHYPQIKLKNLQWKKLDASITEKTIWKMEDEEESDMEKALEEHGAFEKIEALFPAKINTFLEKRLAASLSNQKADIKNDAIKFLTKNKNRNINIVIFPKIKHFDSYKDVRDHILAMDDKLCTETFLINLITYAPSREDDLVTMQKFLDGPEEDRQNLDLPEQFTIEMMRIYRYEVRIKFMLFRLQYWEKFEQLRRSLGVVLDASDALRNSKPLRKLLQLILLLGNYMNGTSQQGGAFGMKIDSINKLADTKASDESQLTLLHCLVGIVRRQFPSILEFIDDLKDVNEATRVMASINDIVLQYTEMRQGIKQLGLELETYWPNPDQVKKLEQFEARKRINNATEDHDPKIPNSAEEDIYEDGDTNNNHVEEEKNEENDGFDKKEDTEDKEATNLEKISSVDQETNDFTAEKKEERYIESIEEQKEGGKAKEKKNLGELTSDEAAAEVVDKEIMASLDRFTQVMDEYHHSANDRFEELEALYVNVDAKWRDIMIYYGENPKLTRPDEFFNVFSQFLTSWKHATVEELKYSERLEREEKRRQELEEKRKAFLRSANGDETSDSDGASTATTTGGEGGDNDRRVMDDLLEQLRSGKAENRMRQRRVRERLKRLKQHEEEEQQQHHMKKPIADRRKVTRLSVVTTRRDSASSTTTSQIPIISAEDLLRSLQQEED